MSSTAYMAQYMLRRYHERRAQAVARLGARCATCGTPEGPFEFDHVEREGKRDALSKLWGYGDEVFESELAKCQLLCVSCHRLKTCVEVGRTPARGTHGTLSAYRYCGPPKCEPCKRAKRENQAKNRTLRAPVA